ncbi:MAG: hypothetical protein JWN30_1267 [Bacilli bacterium]|nr:hypothetical protein [Bacilli bacterium]
MTNKRFDELFDKAYEGSSIDSTEAVELVNELDSAYKRISEQTRVVTLLQIEINQLRSQLKSKEALGV